MSLLSVTKNLKWHRNQEVHIILPENFYEGKEQGLINQKVKKFMLLFLQETHLMDLIHTLPNTIKIFLSALVVRGSQDVPPKSLSVENSIGEKSKRTFLHAAHLLDQTFIPSLYHKVSQRAF